MDKLSSNNPLTAYGIGLAFIFSLASILLIAIFGKELPPQVPLFYSRPWGEEVLAHPLSLFSLPLASFLFLGLNLFIISSLRQKPLLVIILTSSAALFAFLCFFDILKIIALTA